MTQGKSRIDLIELVHKKNIEALRKELGTFDLDLTPEKLDEIREAE